jgi:hypothetical protein
MANLENFKDVRTITSVSALLAVGVASSYFLTENSSRKEEIAELKKHLSTVIPHVNPDISKILDRLMTTVNLLDSKLTKAEEDIKILQKSINGDENQTPKRSYQRITQKGDGSDDAIINTKLKYAPRRLVTSEKEADIDDDVAAMMG